MPPTDEPCRNFMIDNLKVKGESDKRATEQQIIEAIEEILKEIGFTFSSPQFTVKSFGYMPDFDSATDHRYWVTFEVDQSTALQISEQKYGKNEQIQNMNKETLGTIQNKKCLKLKKYKGVENEAIRMTLGKASRILAETLYPQLDGFDMQIAEQKIILMYEDKIAERLTIESLVKDHRDVFHTAVRKLPLESRKIMYQLVSQIQKTSLKRALNDETMSTAAAAIHPYKIARIDTTPVKTPPFPFPPISPILPKTDNEPELL